MRPVVNRRYTTGTGVRAAAGVAVSGGDDPTGARGGPVGRPGACARGFDGVRAFRAARGLVYPRGGDGDAGAPAAVDG